MSDERRTTFPYDASATAAPLVEARFVPQRYEPNYAYPLLVLFHGRGGDEHQMVRSMPAMSWRNYVGLGLRGPETAIRREHHDGYGWGEASARAVRLHRPAAPRLPAREVVRRALDPGGPVDPVDLVEDGVFTA